MPSLVALSLASLAMFASACVTDTAGAPDGTLAPTALGRYGDLRIELDTSLPDGVVQATLRAGTCVELDDATSILLGGVAPASRTNGSVEHGADPSLDPICHSPQLAWPAPVDHEPEAEPELVVSDATTTYTAVFDRPFVARTIAVAPPGAPEVLHSGARLALRVSPSAGELSSGTGRLHGAVPEADAVIGWTAGAPASLALTLPALEAASDGDIAIGIGFDLPVLACDAPGGCVAHALTGATLAARFAP